MSGVTKTLSNMVKKFEVNRTKSKFSIICSLETFINQRDRTFLARSIRARITREKFLHVQKNVNIHTVKSVKSIRNILCGPGVDVSSIFERIERVKFFLEFGPETCCEYF